MKYPEESPSQKQIAHLTTRAGVDKMAVGYRKIVSMSERKAGDIIGDRYRLTELIGSGGMGQIFKAADTQLFQRTVALKLLTVKVTAQPKVYDQLRRRFEEEACISALLGEHPRIIQILNYGLDQDQPYLVMEYLGQPPHANHLGELIKEKPGMDPQRVVRLAQQICSGLDHAHRFVFTLENRSILGVIHRDVKPSNIFVVTEDRVGEMVKILDFGVAKAVSDININLGTMTGFVGTPCYASPEQLRGETPDPRSDIYSLGVVLFEMLTGVLPLMPKTQSFSGWYEAHNYTPPRTFDQVVLRYALPAALQQLVMSCLEKDPTLRPQSMKSLSDALEESLKQVVPEPSTTWLTDPRKPALSSPAQSLTVEDFSAEEEPIGSGRLSAQVQKEIEGLLMNSIGPIGPVMLQEALSQTQTLSQLVDQLAGYLPPPHRSSFRQKAQDLIHRIPQAPSSSLGGGTAGGINSTGVNVGGTKGMAASQPAISQPTLIDPQFLQNCQQQLTDLVGPMASFVMQQVLTQSPHLTSSQLIEALADQIPDRKKAQEFRRRINNSH